MTVYIGWLQTLRLYKVTVQGNTGDSGQGFHVLV